MKTGYINFEDGILEEYHDYGDKPKMMNLTPTQLKRYKKLTRFGLYLCGPIKNKTDEEVHAWRNRIKSLLIAYPITVFDPTKRDYRAVLEEATSLDDLAIIDEEIVTIDTEEIMASHALIANCFEASAGSSMEIFMAWRLRRFIVTLVPDPLRTSPWIRYHSSVLVTNYGDAFQELRNIFPTVFGIRKGLDE